MKYLIYVSLLFLSFGLALQRSPLLSTKAEKKVRKSIQKIYNTKEVRFLPAHIADSVSFLKNENLYYLYVADSITGTLVVRRIQGCKIGGCEKEDTNTICTTQFTLYFDETGFETFDYAVLIGNDKKVKYIQVINYPGEHGYEITAKNWLKQFIDYDGRTLYYGKDIDAISGATISASSLTWDIQLVYDELIRLIEPLAESSQHP